MSTSATSPLQETRRTDSLPAGTWGTASLAFFCFTVFGHDMVSQAYVSVFKVYGRTIMESRLHWGFLALLAVATATTLIHPRLRGAWDVRRTLGAMLALSLVYASDALLISTNVERIHYAQYALLAILLRRWTANDLLVLTLCTLGGALDELWQYAAYPWYTKYFDFNDIILNMAGAALGLFLTAPPARAALSTQKEHLAATVTYLAILSMGLTGLALAATGFFAEYTALAKPQSVLVQVQGSTRFVLSFIGTGPWSDTGFGRVFHIMPWNEGLAAIPALWVMIAVWLNPARRTIHS